MASKGKAKKRAKPEALVKLLDLEHTAEAVSRSVPTVRVWLKLIKSQFSKGDPKCPVVAWGGNGRPYEINAEMLVKWVNEQDEKARPAEADQQAAVAAMQNSLDLEGGEVLGLSAVPFDIRKKGFDADLARQRAAKGRGELVSVADERAEWDRVFSFLSTNLQALPDHLARQCDLPTSVVAVIDEKVRDWQESLARQLMDRKDLAIDVDTHSTGNGELISS